MIYAYDIPCKKCSHNGLKYNTHPQVYTLSELTRKCPICGINIIYKSIYKKKYADRDNKICHHCGGKIAIKSRKPFSLMSKAKMRLAIINKLKTFYGTGLHPNYNLNACEYFDWLNKWNGWNGQFATNGGEYFIKNLGYWVDYYEPKENVVIEWDEPRHYDRYGNLTHKDLVRMNEIKNEIKCDFYRINGRTKELKKYG